MFFWNSLAFSMIQLMVAIISLVPLPLQNPGCTSESSLFMCCWSLVLRILSITLIACGLPKWHSWLRICLQCWRCKSWGFNFWVMKISWRRKWQPTLVFLLGNFLGQGSLAGFSPRGHRESNMAEYTCTQLISIWNEHSCLVVWTFFGIVFLWDRKEKWPFPVLWPLLSFPIWLIYWVQHFSSSIF